MAASDQHQLLVQFLLTHVGQELGATAALSADLGLAFGLPRPAPIGGTRPDAFARCLTRHRVVVAEAKTRWDVSRPHTELQLMAYFQFLAAEKQGELWLAVPWAGVDEMHAAAVRCRRLAGGSSVPFTVFGLNADVDKCIRTVKA